MINHVLGIFCVLHECGVGGTIQNPVIYYFIIMFLIKLQETYI